MKPIATPKPIRAADREPAKPLTQQYRPPFTPLTPDNYDLYAGRSLAMLARAK